MFDVIDTHDGSAVVASFPTFRRAKNAARKLEGCDEMPAGGWRFLISKRLPVPDVTALPVLVFYTFNTGRMYTAHGQRIAWVRLNSGNVAMWDRDRMIDYVLAFPKGPTPHDADVLRAYDERRTVPYTGNEHDYRIALELRDQLHTAAGKVPAYLFQRA